MSATDKQKRFVDIYLANKKTSATRAAIEAGYSEAGAHVQASRMLRNPKIRAYLDEKEADIKKELQSRFLYDAIEARKVLADIMNDDEARDIDRISAAKDFLDRAGFRPTEKLEHSGGIGFKVDWGSDEEDKT